MRPKRDRILSLLSIAERGGFVKSGEFQTEASVKEGSACLVIVAKDASDNTRKKFQNSCTYYAVPFLLYADRETLGHAIGKDFRASVSVTDKGLADRIRELYEIQSPEKEEMIWEVANENT
ncbi:MAG: ribosomal L7Ae/L30e/S12e/Gadd45 family protein [Lachnospiraceae bacterium]|nr:ribosomal L7Ae/L30e/S12e/Gadd45 family protein [Lachnospiraceae bacterium]